MVLTSRQAAIGGASRAARLPDAPLALHEGTFFAYKISKAALNRGVLFSGLLPQSQRPASALVQ